MDVAKTFELFNAIVIHTPVPASSWKKAQKFPPEIVDVAPPVPTDKSVDGVEEPIPTLFAETSTNRSPESTFTSADDVRTPTLSTLNWSLAPPLSPCKKDSCW